MKRILNILLLLASLIGYLEWGGGNHAFLGQAEYELLFKKAPESATFLHPFVLVPLCGQLLLLITVFQKETKRILTFIALACLSLIMVFLFVIGLMSGNVKVALSAVPFIVIGVLVVRYNRRSVH